MRFSASKWNHSLRASTCTRLFQAKEDEQMIKNVSGHKSDAVRQYKHVNDSLRRKASAAIQGYSNESASTSVKSSPVKSCAQNNSDSDDFVPCLQPITKFVRCRHSGKEQVLEGSDTGDICKFINDIASEKKYKKIRINVELFDSE